jgi:cytochrome c553
MTPTTYFLLILLCAVSGAGRAEEASALGSAAWQQALAAKPEGDPAKGSALYDQFGCPACHGATGSPSNPAWPVLTGQRPLYLYKMLLDYRAGRVGGSDAATMSAMAKPLDETSMAHIAAWLGSLARPAPSAEAGTAPAILGGDRTRLMPPCEGCHGANAQGWDLQPALSGQHREFIAAALTRFKTGERANDINGGMGQFARKLSETEIRDLAGYFGR